MTPDVLIVENDVRDLEDAVSLLHGINKNDKDKYWIDSLRIAPAKTLTEAIRSLEAKAKNKEAFDIVLLDLDLEEPGDDRSEVYRGFDLLRAARELAAALDVVIYTSHAGFENLLRALREGAADFISKSTSDAEKQTRVLGAWRRAMEKKSDRILEQRLRQLIPYAQRAAAQRLTPCFSELVQSVVYAAEKIEGYAKERYGLDAERDAEDSLMQALTMHRETVAKAQKQWSCLQSDLSPWEAKLGEETLKSLLNKITEELQPCLMIKETKLTLEIDGDPQVQSFGGDVGAVLRELLTGVLSDLPDHGNQRFLRVAVDVNGEKRRAEIRFRDDLDRIPSPTAKMINDGLSLIEDKSFGRLWGLQIAQQIAMLGGGRLQVEPDLRQGNTVTCFLPLA